MYKNLKIYIVLMLSISMLVISLPRKVQAQDSFVNRDQLSKGVVAINHDNEEGQTLRVMISMESQNYTYSFQPESSYPLQFGNGQYTISLLQRVKGTRYIILKQEKIDLVLDGNNTVFLQSVQNINWSREMEAIKMAQRLVKDKSTDLEKVRVIYDFIVKNINYDESKAKVVTSGYLPSIDATYNSGTGICYDYSSLFAAMLRSVGIPAKLMMGHKSDLSKYHAWNQVYLSESGTWITIDTTYDATTATEVKMIKSNAGYSVDKEY